MFRQKCFIILLSRAISSQASLTLSLEMLLIFYYFRFKPVILVGKNYSAVKLVDRAVKKNIHNFENI